MPAVDVIAITTDSGHKYVVLSDGSRPWKLRKSLEALAFDRDLDLTVEDVNQLVKRAIEMRREREGV